jgi:hypothetical protein
LRDLGIEVKGLRDLGIKGLEVEGNKMITSEFNSSIPEYLNS